MRALLRAAALLAAAAVPVVGGVPLAPARAATSRCATTPDQQVARPWQQSRLQPGRVWPLTRGAGVTVAVIDSGVDATSPHLRGAVDVGPDVLGRPGGGSGVDCSGHGTEVASLVAGRVLAGTPFAGIAPEARVLSIRQTERLEQGQPRGTTNGMATAIRAAVAAGARVINISATAEGSTPALKAAVDYAVAHDVVVVAAAGNDDGTRPAGDDGSTPPTYYPAAYPEVLAVAATDSADARADTSHAADYVDVAAPGQQVVVAGANGPGRYAVVTGTSFATPLVAGTVALVRAYLPQLTAAQVVARIEATADAPPAGRDAGVGAGVVDPYAAVTAVLPAEGAAGVHSAPPVAAAALPVPRHAHRTSLIGVVLAAAGLGAAALLAVVALVLPRGRRRGWAPGRVTAPSAAGTLAAPRAEGADVLAGIRTSQGPR
ncbi:type VII secretion-associated serine protease mycosin [Motilibacter peucedani]|uniref:Type VII secretion-associated serine protease mycosin n=1 Tax=Motilibacter peucedani TaxID=598650 RepID=A0A420XN22_9ACTN|nr:type VII secretion-associated serine protease mycosin [Motilibacter peucedani]RKS72669.1 type VII secretion-associated serine protease mycosin [Motilibacter peucedani]